MGEIHMGQSLERALRRTTFSISKIASALSVSRRTVDDWFRMEVIDEQILERISNVVKHDLQSIRLEATVNTLTTEDSLPIGADIRWKDKYITLIERYSNLKTIG
jgi:transcriptional regulator with XRE-family HTH domain